MIATKYGVTARLTKGLGNEDLIGTNKISVKGQCLILLLLKLKGVHRLV